MNTTKQESRIFLIADTHFGDENIRLYEERPFPDTDTMDREIIRRWNSVVSDNDLVYHLGDFCSGGQARCRELLSQLKGRKFLVIGNHDTYLSPQEWRDLGFEECYNLPVILKDFFILSHAPLYVCRSMPYANLYGHVHSHPSYRTVSSRSACVSVERIDYTPILLETLREQIREAEKQETLHPSE
ncbi:MAG: metallophosphoesterase [Lachnospiraceae bacterium]|nr:metallophosphoesterase [Lachnospiraceae bacterium]